MLSRVPEIRLILAVQAVSLFMTVAVVLLDLSRNMESSKAEAYGGTLTMLIIMLGLITHLESRKGRVSAALVALIAIAAPVYAYIGGTMRHVYSYHGIVLAVHLFVIWNLNKYRHKQTNPGNGGAS